MSLSSDWQGYVFALAALWFALTLVPTTLDAESRVPRKTSVCNIGLSLVIGTTHLSLGFVGAFLINVAICGQWVYIALRRSTNEPA